MSVDQFWEEMRNMIHQIEHSGYDEVTVTFGREKKDEVDGEGLPVTFYFSTKEKYEDRNDRVTKKIFEAIYDRFRTIE